MNLKPFTLFLSAVLFSCSDSNPEKEPEETPEIITEEATSFNAFFTRYGNGWTGGDVAYSIRLPDNRDLWLFGDTFLGEVNPDRSRTPQGFVNNSFVIMDGDEATTLVGSGPSAFVKPENAEEKYWPQHGFVKNNKLYVFMYTWRNTGTGGAFGFEYLRTDLAIFDLPSITLTEIIAIPGKKVIWGCGIMEHGDHIYIYGSEDTSGKNYMHLARIRSDDVEGTWEYYTAFGWAQDAAASKRILEGVSNHFSVFQYKDAYYLINHDDSFSHEIHRYKATTPEGPFTDKLLIYTTPSLGQDTWTYNAKAHVQYLQEDGKLLISHDANTLAFNDLFENADFYRPYFVWIQNWQ